MTFSQLINIICLIKKMCEDGFGASSGAVIEKFTMYTMALSCMKWLYIFFSVNSLIVVKLIECNL